MPPSVFPTGTTIYKPEKAFNSYVLYDGRDGRSFLIDMNGHIVRSWPYTGRRYRLAMGFLGAYRGARVYR